LDAPIQGAWYARRGGKSGELYTLIHLPYTSMVLSYVLIGAAMAPVLYLDRLLMTLAAYFLGLGLSAHALNELYARHWGDALTVRELKSIFAFPLIGALTLGGYGTYILYSTPNAGLSASITLLIFIIVEVFFLFAYNTGYSKGKFHNDISFAFSWAAMPSIISYFVNATSLTLSIILISIGLAATAGIEINLSRWCKDFRRRSGLSELHFEDGTQTKLSTKSLIERPEKALKLIVLAVDLMGVGVLLWRLIG
jgi:hypothetical protein